MALTIDEKTRIGTLAADSRKAGGIVVLDVHELSSVTDRYVICHGNSDRQVKAIADAIVDDLRKNGEKPFAVEGLQQASWILIDCSDLVIHVFDVETRRLYNLERLWHQAPRLIVDGIAPEETPVLV